MDLFEPSGHGRKRRAAGLVEETNENGIPKAENYLKKYNNTQFTKIKENIEYTVMMPSGK